MKAVVFHGPGDIRLDEVREPRIRYVVRIPRYRPREARADGPSAEPQRGDHDEDAGHGEGGVVVHRAGVRRAQQPHRQRLTPSAAQISMSARTR